MLCEPCHIYVSGDVLTLYWQVVNPGGVLVHTQFWDLNYGVADSWGIHGLWYASEKLSLFSFIIHGTHNHYRPDKCNNQYYENCDSGRAYSSSQIADALQGQSDLVNFMNTYWVSNDESPPDFWAHEVRNKH